jgi:uncharacterized membrane protein YeiB
VFEGLKVTSCLAPTEAVKRGCLAHRHTTLRVEEFGVATSGGVWVAIGALTLAIFFGIQVPWRYWWLRAHERGPMEAPWARMTYGRRGSTAPLKAQISA